MWLLAFVPLLASEPETLVSSRLIHVRREPSSSSALRGTIPANEPFRVFARVEGKGCDGGWALVEAEGYTCLTWATPTEEPPVALPRLLAFDPPTPDEYWSYRETGTWERDPPESAEELLPLIYGKRWRRWSAPTWPSLRDYERGRPSEEQLDTTRKHGFAREVQTERGTVLVKADGTTVPLDKVYVYPTSRFQGRNLVDNPLPADILPAWVFRYDGGRVRLAPDRDAEIAATLAHLQHLIVDATPASPDSRWWRIPNGAGPGIDGYVDSEQDIRRWYEAPPPAEVSEDQIWIDIERSQQVLAVRQGARLLYVTLISSGTSGRWESPRGLYEVYDQMIWGDMASLEGAEEQYHVEKVPWIAHFYPRLALHGAFWHWGFGHKVSHGCINLAPRDADWIMDQIKPALPDGWQAVYLKPDEPGTLLRIREGDAEPPDKRKR